jgi:hypothetical protein
MLRTSGIIPLAILMYTSVMPMTKRSAALIGEFAFGWLSIHVLWMAEGFAGAG